MNQTLDETAQAETIINLYCPNGIQCAGACLHGPNPAQKVLVDALYTNKYTSLLALGGFRSGKTSEGARLAINLCVEYPGNRVLATRKYTTDFPATFGATIATVMPDELVLKFPTHDKPYYLLRSSGEEPSELWCLGLYGTDRKRLGKFKGAEFGHILVDQPEELQYDDFIFLKSRLSLKRVPHRAILLFPNPPNVGHWMHQYFEVEKDKHDQFMCSFPTAANKANIPDGYIEELTREYADRPGWLKCYLEGKWGYVVKGDPAYAGFRDSHIKKIEYDSSRILYRSWDWGWQHPAVGWYQIQPEGGLHKLHENLGTNIDLRKYARQITLITNEKFPGAAVQDFGDHAGHQRSDKSDNGKSSIDILKSEFDITVKTRPTLSIDAGVSLVQKYISLLCGDRPGFTVSPSCTITIDGVQGGYCRDEHGQILKDGFYEHVMDTDRYAFWNLFQNETNAALQKARTMKIRTATYNFSGTRR